MAQNNELIGRALAFSQENLNEERTETAVW